MKRIGNIYDRMLSDENIRKAILDVNKSHRWFKGHKPNPIVLWVDATIEERIKELRSIIENGYVQQKPVVKRRYDKNARKWRDISEPHLWPDQYVHHILIQVLEPVMMRGMDPYCCGSIKGRGTHYGIKAIKKWMKSRSTDTRWCAELDIYHFYEQLQPDVVMARLRELIKDRRVLDLCERTLSYGVTIGAYYSQWYANTVLQPLDRMIRECGVTHYVRYMDNFTLFARDKRTLRKTIKKIRKWLADHDLRLKDNAQYFPTKSRMPNALGYRFGRGYTLLRKNRVLALKRQARTYYRKNGKVSAKFAMSFLARASGLDHCNCFDLRHKLLPKGRIKKLKKIISKDSKRRQVPWSTYLEAYIARERCA